MASTGVVIKNNILDSIKEYGISLQSLNSPKIIGNKLSNTTTLYFGIYVTGCLNAIQILKNQIIDGNYYGLYYINNNSAASPALIANNFFVASSGNPNYYAMIVSGSSYTNVYFNNCYSFSSAAAAAVQPNGTNINIMNNNFVNTGGGLAFYNTSQANNFIVNCDYNNYYTSGSTLALWNNVSYSTVHALSLGSGKDKHSISVNPNYTSATNLHVSNTALHDAGLPLASVKDDIDGQIRGQSAVTIGADEIFPNSNDAGISGILPSNYAAGTQTIQARIENFGNNTLTSATINWTFNGVAQTAFSWTGSLASSQTAYATIGSKNFVAGNSYTIKAWTSLPNGKTDSDTLNDTFIITTCPGLSGTYTIGSGGNFASFNAAISAMACGGVAGPVTFKVLAGTYNEQVDLPQIANCNQTNSITFDGGTGNASTRILTYQASNPDSAYTFRVDNSAFITIKNLTVQATGATYGTALSIYGASEGCHVTDCILQISGAGATNGSQYFTPLRIDDDTNVLYTYYGNNIYANNYYQTPATSHSLLIDSNLIENGYAGIFAFVNLNWNNRFIGNKIINSYGYGVILYGFDGVTFNGNTIDLGKGGSINSYGLYIYNSTTYPPVYSAIEQNKIYNAGQFGMYLYLNNYAANPALLVNNMIGGGFKDSTSAAYGIYIYAGSYWNIWYNTVNMDITNSTATSAALYENGSYCDIRDNIFAVTGTNGNASQLLPVYIPSIGSVVAFNYNNIFKSGITTSQNLIYFGQDYSQSNYQGGSGYNINSVSLNPDFISDTDLHVKSPCMNNLGTPIPGYAATSVDIDNNPRSTTTPDMGADEYSPAAYDAGVVSITAPATNVVAGTSYNLTAKVVNYGSANITALEVSYQLNTGKIVTQKLTGLSLSPCDTLTVTFNSISGAGGKDQRIKFGNDISTVTVYTDTINATNADQYHANDTMHQTYCTVLSGTFTINNSIPASLTNFTSFNAAVKALSGCGIGGPVIFNVANDTFNEQVKLGFVNGISAANTITFQSASGDSSKAVLTYPASNVATSNYTMEIDSCPYITLKKISILRSGGSSYVRDANCLATLNGAHNIQVLNCQIITYGGGTNNVIMSGDDSLNVFKNNLMTGIVNISGNAPDMLISGNVISSGGFNIFATAPDMVVSGNNISGGNFIITGITTNLSITGNLLIRGGFDVTGSSHNTVISKNTIDSANYCIQVNSLWSPLIEYNTVNYCSAGIEALSCHDSTIIRKNKIYVNSGTGIYMQNDSGIAGEVALVANNFIAGSGGTYQVIGIYSSNCLYSSCLYNSINIQNANAGSVGATFDAYSSGTTNNIAEDNNIINTGGGKALEITGNAVSVNYLSVCDYNNIYTGTTDLVSYNGFNYTSLASYQTASGFDLHSISINPYYLSSTSPNDSNPALKTGLPQANVKDDIYGDVRNKYRTCIGAYEFSVPDDAGIDSILSPSVFGGCGGKSNVTVRLRDFGITGISYAQINWSVNGVAQTAYNWTGSISSGSSTNVTIGNYTFGSGVTYTVKVWTSKPNGDADANTSNDTTSIIVNTSFSGTYTIGASGANYKTFNAAVKDLIYKGVCGPVTFNVFSGTYNEQVRIPYIAGTSATNTITFKSLANDSSKVILSQASSATPNNNYIILLDSAKYITFKKITIQRTGNKFYGILLETRDGANYNKITNDVLTGLQTTKTGSDQALIYSGDADTSNTFSHNLMKYGSYGVYLAGYSGAVQKNIVVDSNNIDSAYYTGIFLSYHSAVKVIGNSITNIQRTGGSAYGISIDNCINASSILKNRIVMPNGGSGFYSNASVGQNNATPLLIANNFISVGGTGASYGIYSNQDNKTAYFYNSVLVTNTSANSYAAYFASSSSNYTINDFNNIFDNTGGGYSIGTNSSNYINNSDFNDLVVTGSYLGNYNGIISTTLGGWQGASGLDQDDVSADPYFNSNTDLHANSLGIYGKATPVAQVTDDIDGQKRSLTTPDIGADEFTPILPDAGISAVDSPLTNFCAAARNVYVTLNEYNVQRLIGVKINWSVNDTIQTPYLWTGFLFTGTGGTSSAVVKIGSFNFSAGNNKVKVWTSKPDDTTDSKHSNDTTNATIKVNTAALAYTGPNKSTCIGAGTTIGRTGVAGNTYSWVSNPTGFTSTSANPSINPTITTTYTLTETTPGNCSKTNSVIITVNPLPIANAGSNQTICSGNTANIGAAAVSGDTYSWTSSPSGFTSTVSNPVVSPTTTTTYYLTETAAVGCSKSNQVVITVNPSPVANAGTNKSICNGDVASIGANAVSGDTYSWGSNPSGYSSTSSKATVNPTVTTTYYLTETITLTGCNKTDSVIITVNPLPAANAGSAKSICNQQITSIGAASVSGNTYSWTSNPVGFTSTNANPNVSPTTTTTYTLTETISITGCNKTNTVIISVNPLPLAKAGSNKVICNGSNASIGGTAVAGDTYIWSSNPTGYVSTNASESVSPSVTTTYYITETITATGCSKTDSVIITVNPLPVANAGSSQTICNGTGASIGAAAVSGDTYSWTSNPTGYSSTNANPSVSPATTTTYYLNEKITLTGCNKTDSVIITVNPIPSSPSPTNNGPVCASQELDLFASTVSGASYAWTGPNGFTSTMQNPIVTISDTADSGLYAVTATVNGCTSPSSSINAVVNPQPKAYTGATQTILCIGQGATIGATAVAGDIYSWTSAPAGFTNTSSDPLVAPTVTTTYYLTESITLTGCSKSDSVVIEVHPLPTAGTGGNKTICASDSAKIGKTAIKNNKYSWTSNPAGFTSSISNPYVSPTVTTTYTLVETVNSLCTKTDSMVMTVNPQPAAAAGTSKAVCAGYSGSISIGAAAVAGDKYSWTSNPSGYNSTIANPSVTPTATTTYYLTETVKVTNCGKSDSVVITINPLPIAVTGGNQSICFGNTASLGVAPLSSNSYSWTSKPTGYNDTTSDPVVQPTVTTTYYLTEKVIVAGCFKTDSAVITVNPLPMANTGGNTSLCMGSSLQIGSTAVSGNTYTWASNPAGFDSSSSNPMISPSSSATYYLTEKDTNTGCSKSDSAIITVNPLPAANTGSSKTVCAGTSTNIGYFAVSGSTYSWASNPTGFSDTTSSPGISPATTTTYYLTETIAATHCFKTDSVIITVNPLPAANAGSNTSVCLGDSTNIGGTAVSGSTYSWASNPAGFADTSANPSVKPTVTTTYYLTETVSVTHCNKSDSVVVTVNALPGANAGANANLCFGSSTNIGATMVSGDSYSWASNPSGFADTTSNPLVNPTVTTTYYLTEKVNLTGCIKMDSSVITVNPLPSANTGGNSAVCYGNSTNIGAAAVSGDTYSWASNPGGFNDTTSNPSVSPTATTTYYLKETITATSCFKTDSAVITVNPLPSASTGGNKAICNGSGTNVGATGVSGNTYSWTSNPTGFNDTTSNPSVSPTATTTYYLTETVTATSCFKMDSAVITVNPLPAANSGGNQAICFGNATNIGATAVTGSTYTWASGPAGFSDTTSNPSVSPTVTTTYYLTETVTATGCFKMDSVIITVNPLPAANAGNNQAICFGSSTNIGATAVTGSTYSWASNPTGFSDTTSSPSVSPTINTTYYLTEKAGITGCVKMDSVVVTVNPLPLASTGGNKNICQGGSINIGDSAVSGSSYSWSSNPSGFSDTTSSLSVSPTATTTYYLTEKTTATGCFKTDSATVTVNPLPSANAGGNSAVCMGSGTRIGSAAVSGNVYSWVSNPSGFADTASNPTVSPTINTTYYLTEKISLTGCAKTDSAIIIVNPLPAANAGNNTAICFAGTTTIGSTAVNGNTYTWYSNPAGFADTTANPTVSPTTTSTYYLTEKITATGCSKSDSVVITVNPLPVVKAGKGQSICNGSAASIGDSAVTGYSYSWTSSPSGFTATNSTSLVSPTVTTSYYLTETIVATGCNKSDSVAIIVNPLPAANTGGAQSICSGSVASIGGAAVTGNSYSWSSSPSGFSNTASGPSVSPISNTTYYLTEKIIATGCSKSDSVVITVNPLPSANAGANAAICFGNSGSIGAAAVTGNTYSWTSKPTGFSGTGANPSVSPTVTTTYYLTEKITATGCSKSDSVVVTVNPLPLAKWSYYVSPSSPLQITFNPNYVSSANYSWHFGDGDSAGAASPLHVYAKDSTYAVRLVVTNPTGCSAEYDSTITVGATGIYMQNIPVSAVDIYPNPFNEQTTISYQLANASHIQIEVSDLQMKGFIVLADEIQVSGVHTATLDANKYHLSAGTYLVRIFADGQPITKKVIKLK